MNNSKGIFKSSKLINTGTETKKVKLQTCISTKNIELED
jgi:hypothetical protein